MGYFSNLGATISDMLWNGYTYDEIADALNLTREQVREYATMIGDADDDNYPYEPEDAHLDSDYESQYEIEGVDY